MPDAQRGQKMTLDSPGIELQTAGNCHLGRNQTGSSRRAAITPASKYKLIQGSSPGKRKRTGACLPEGRVMEEALEHGD